jgi:diacylglycerol kinase family enzyme
VAAGVDLVAGYGGDGTQMELANGMLGSNIPMATLPGGTGNALASD